MMTRLRQADARGFARYCPTFKRIYDCVVERIENVRVPERDVETALEWHEKTTLMGSAMSWWAGLLRKHPEEVRIAGKLLTRGSDRVKAETLRALEIASYNGGDIRPAVSGLRKFIAMSCEDSGVVQDERRKDMKERAAFLLMSQYLDTENKRGVESLRTHRDEDIRRGAEAALAHDREALCCS